MNTTRLTPGPSRGGPYPGKRHDEDSGGSKGGRNGGPWRGIPGPTLCWTGTVVSIAANKVPGVRAALCTDAATASGARQWNHANVLVMGLRLTSREIAKEILEAWFSTPPGEGEDAATVARLAAIDDYYRSVVAGEHQESGTVTMETI